MTEQKELSPEDVKRLEGLVRGIETLEKSFDTVSVRSRSLSLCRTKLDEAHMWGKRALAELAAKK